jgi:hypothetical protein
MARQAPFGVASAWLREPNPTTQIGLYILFCVMTVVFVTFTVHTTWKDNLGGDQSVRLTDLIKVLVQFLQ